MPHAAPCGRVPNARRASGRHTVAQVARARAPFAGVLPAGFEENTFICDGTKDLSKRSRIYEEQEKDYSRNKGHGKSHLLFCDLFGKGALDTQAHAHAYAHARTRTRTRAHMPLHTHHQPPSALVHRPAIKRSKPLAGVNNWRITASG
eukprot:7386763-Prymnesium_polylepis.2